MPRLLTFPALAVVLVALLLAGSAQARPKPHHKARPKPTCATVGRTLTADASVRVYRRDREVADNDFTSPANFACWLPKHRSRFLGWVEDCTYPGGVARHFVLHGRLLAYFLGACDVNAPPGDLVRVLDVGTGGVRADAAADEAFADLVFLGGHGVAWIQEQRDTFFAPEPATRQVRALDPFPCPTTCAPGVGAVLDTGAGIEEGSLATAGRWIYWTRDGTPRSHRTGGLVGSPLPTPVG